MNESKKAIVVKSGREVEVYKLKTGTPTDKHIWCNCKGCTETFTHEELDFTASVKAS